MWSSWGEDADKAKRLHETGGEAEKQKPASNLGELVNAEEGEVGGGEAARAGGAQGQARGGHASQVTN